MKHKPEEVNSKIERFYKTNYYRHKLFLLLCKYNKV